MFERYVREICSRLISSFRAMILPLVYLSIRGSNKAPNSRIVFIIRVVVPVRVNEQGLTHRIIFGRILDSGKTKTNLTSFH
jgi:hypothetical protein